MAEGKQGLGTSQDEPFADFQWNEGWGIWEQVPPKFRNRKGVVTAYSASTVQGLKARIADLEKALEPFRGFAEQRYADAHEALQVGGYVPTDPDFPVEVPFGWIEDICGALDTGAAPSPHPNGESDG